jgi:hypothetical protein
MIRLTIEIDLILKNGQRNPIYTTQYWYNEVKEIDCNKFKEEMDIISKGISFDGIITYSILIEERIELGYDGIFGTLIYVKDEDGNICYYKDKNQTKTNIDIFFEKITDFIKEHKDRVKNKDNPLN